MGLRRILKVEPIGFAEGFTWYMRLIPQLLTSWTAGVANTWEGKIIGSRLVGNGVRGVKHQASSFGHVKSNAC